MTANRLEFLRERIESGTASADDRDEWLRLSISAFPAAMAEHIEAATRDLQQRARGVTEGGLPQLFADLKRQWGDEAARTAWKAAEPARRHGREAWNAIPPRRSRGRRMSDREHFVNNTLALRTFLKQGHSSLSAEKAAAEVVGGADPGRRIRRVKARQRGSTTGE